MSSFGLLRQKAAELFGAPLSKEFSLSLSLSFSLLLSPLRPLISSIAKDSIVDARHRQKFVCLKQRDRPTSLNLKVGFAFSPLFLYDILTD